MRFLLIIQLQPFTMGISNTCSQGCEEDNGFKEENEVMATLNFFFFQISNDVLHLKIVFSP